MSSDNSEQMNAIIGRLLKTNDAEETKQIYKDWSESYNEDLAGFGYVAPQTCVTLLDETLSNRDGLILDAGCGTGLCGQLLAERGYTRIHGADFSPDMLAKAQATSHYQQLTEADFYQPLSIESALYDGAICCGVYKSIFKEHFFTELIRITKPGGVICLSCRFNYFDSDLLLQAQAQEETGAITIEKITKQPYMTGQDADAAYIVFRKK